MTLEERVERIERASHAYAETWEREYDSTGMRGNSKTAAIVAMNAFVNVMLQEPTK